MASMSIVGESTGVDEAPLAFWSASALVRFRVALLFPAQFLGLVILIV